MIDMRLASVVLAAFAFSFGSVVFIMFYIGAGQRRHLILGIVCAAAMIGAVLLVARPILYEGR
jgi:hypothetical protein